MPTNAEIARYLGVDRSYITRLVQRGMPTGSFRLAKVWKNAHASKRAPTDPKQLARFVAEERDDNGSRAGRKKQSEEKLVGVRLPAEDTLDKGLHDAVKVARRAFRLLREAMLEDKDQKISVRIGLFNKASENRFKAETAYREELERRKILISLAVAQDMVRRGLGVIIERLRCLPHNVAPRCNAASPDHAMEVLESECNAILAAAQQVYADNPA
jgi:hypothetical protein